MTIGQTTDQHHGPQETGRGRGPSTTTLSTIAVQAGQSQIVVSVLKSGALVHLQLVQVCPGLCEVGSDQEENRRLIQELQQLMDTLQKHESEVLSAVQRQKSRDQEAQEEEQVLKAMSRSLQEGWSLLLHLLHRRQELLDLASGFYCRAAQFAAGLKQVEELKISPDGNRLTEDVLTSMRKDLLSKSLQVLTSSSILQEKLRQLQRTEAFQRQGRVLQEEGGDQELEEEGSPSSSRTALRLEELLEELQDRRRRADQVFRLLLHQEEEEEEQAVWESREEEEEQKVWESRGEGIQGCRLTADENLDQDQQAESEPEEGPDLRIESRLEETREPESEPSSDEESESTSQPKTDLETDSRSDLRSGFRSRLNALLGSEKNRLLNPGSNLLDTVGPPNRSGLNMLSSSTSEETKTFNQGLRSGVPTGLGSVLKPEKTQNQQSESTSETVHEEHRNLLSDVILSLKARSTSNQAPRSTSNQASGSTSNQATGSTSNQTPGSTSNQASGSTANQTPGSTSNQASGSTSNQESGSTSNQASGSTSHQASGSTSNQTPGSTSNQASGSTSNQTPGSTSNQTPGSTSNQQPGSTSNQVPGSTSNQQPGSTSNQEPGSTSDINPQSAPESTIGLKTSKPKSGSRLKEIKTLQFGIKLNIKSGSRSEVQPDPTLETEDLEPRFSLKNNKAGSGRDLKPDSGQNPKPAPGLQDTKNQQTESEADPSFEFRSEESVELKSGLCLHLNPKFSSYMEQGSKPGHSKDPLLVLESEFKSELRSELHLRSDVSLHEPKNQLSESTLEESKDQVQTLGSELRQGPGSPHSRDLGSGSRSDLHCRNSPEVMPGPDEARDPQTEVQFNLKAEHIMEAPGGPGSEPQSDSEARQDRDVEPTSRPERTRSPQSKSSVEDSKDQQHGSRSDQGQTYRLEESENLDSGSDLDPGPISKTVNSLQGVFGSNKRPGSRTDCKPEPGHGTTPASGLEEVKDLLSRFKLNRKARSRSNQKLGSESGMLPRSKEDPESESGSEQTGDTPAFSRPEETKNLQCGSEVGWNAGSDLQSDSESKTTTDMQSGVRLQEAGVTVQTRSRSDSRQEPGSGETRRLQSEVKVKTKVGPVLDLRSGLMLKSTGNEAPEVGSGETPETDDTGSSSSLKLESRSEPKTRSKSDETKDISKEVSKTQAGSGLDQGLTLGSHLKSWSRPGETKDRLSESGPDQQPERQLNETSYSYSEPKPDGEPRSESALEPEPSLTETTSLQPDSKPEKTEDLHHGSGSQVSGWSKIWINQKTESDSDPETAEERTCGRNTGRTDISPEEQQQVQTSRTETLQRSVSCEDLGKNLISTVSQVSGAGLNIQVKASLVQETLEGLSRTKQEVKEQQENSRKHQERLKKTLQDLNCVSELLDSCTHIDLGSVLQTSRLLDHFTQARPHFQKLDAEVEFTVKGWETLRSEMADLQGPGLREEDLPEMLKLHQRVKNKISQSESILDQTSSFHLVSKQLEALLQQDLEIPITGLCGSREAELGLQREKQLQIQNLLKTVSVLKTDICTAVSQQGLTGFKVEQLEARLQSLDSLCISWLNKSKQREQNLLLTQQLNHDINQLRDSFRELKKRFSNLKFNFMKRNDKSRNMKAVRNQSQQVEMYEDKIQALRKRLQGVTSRLGSEVKDGGVAREVEDAINELHRQMGEFERGVSEHQKTLEMSFKLQQAMDEYQFWCEEASATIARVRKFSSECRSTEAVSVLYQQFEKFVWPTVPQQEERISQISELAVRLHGAEEGRRYIEKTVSKHSEMVQSIRMLSDGLLELEAKLKMENLKQQQKDKKIKEVETEGRREHETEEKDEEKEKKVNRKLKKREQRDNRSMQDTKEMCELKETGHTPELTTERDGKDVPVKRQAAANKKPPLRKSRSQEVDSQIVETESRQRSSSYCSTHTFSLSCSPVLAKRRIHTIHTQSQPVDHQATPPLTGTGLSLSDIQREFQGKETREHAPAGHLSEPELQHHEDLMEDYLSNDEYDCASPDDISLPPLAETPESIMVQSDLEEGVSFSSHSIHISQHSHQHHVQSERGTSSTVGVGQHQRDLTPPSSRHSSSRFRSESSSQNHTASTACFPSPFTSTLSSIVISRANSSVPEKADLPNGPGSPPGSTCINTNMSMPQEIIHSQSKKHTPNKTPHNTNDRGETVIQTDPPPKTEKNNQEPSCLNPVSPPHLSDPDPVLHGNQQQDKTLLESCAHVFHSDTFSQQNQRCVPDSEVDLHRASLQAEDKSYPVSKPQKEYWTSTTMNKLNQHTTFYQSASSSRAGYCAQTCSSLGSGEPRPAAETKSTSRTESAPHGADSYKGNSQQSLLNGSTCAQPCVHDLGMTFSSSVQSAAPPPQPEPQTSALAQRANLHATPPPSPPHPLTPDRDPNICQPTAVREEIRLTPQIQGPPRPAAPPSHAPKPGPCCLTRPLSRASVMEGSPVTLEVEVMGHPEPSLTWSEEGESDPDPVPVCGARKHFQYIPEVSDAGLYEDGADKHGEALQTAGDDGGGGDKWLVAELFEIITVDWLTWFGSLCVLLWLLYLVLL